MSFTLDIWTVYNRPLDYPDKWVARRWQIVEGAAVITDEVIIEDDLMKIRDAMQRLGLTYMPRYQNDDPKIFECWI